jgi:hypothetical protein
VEGWAMSDDVLMKVSTHSLVVFSPELVPFANLVIFKVGADYCFHMKSL